jgi:hypothetical protein
MMKLFMLAAALSLSVSGAALAAGDNANNGSACGQAHAARADVNGNFGFLGALGGTPGYHNGATGQDPGATGYNNSHVDCNPS